MKYSFQFIIAILFYVATVVSAQVNVAPEPIVTPEDARKHGLEDLRKAKLGVCRT